VNTESTDIQRIANDLTNIWQETWRKAFGENKIRGEKLVAKKRLTHRLSETYCPRRVASVWTRINWTRTTHSAWTVESL